MKNKLLLLLPAILLLAGCGQNVPTNSTDPTDPSDPVDPPAPVITFDSEVSLSDGGQAVEEEQKESVMKEMLSSFCDGVFEESKNRIQVLFDIKMKDMKFTINDEEELFNIETSGRLEVTLYNPLLEENSTHPAGLIFTMYNFNLSVSSEKTIIEPIRIKDLTFSIRYAFLEEKGTALLLDLSSKSVANAVPPILHLYEKLSGKELDLGDYSVDELSTLVKPFLGKYYVSLNDLYDLFAKTMSSYMNASQEPARVEDNEPDFSFDINADYLLDFLNNKFQEIEDSYNEKIEGIADEFIPLIKETATIQEYENDVEMIFKIDKPTLNQIVDSVSQFIDENKENLENIQGLSENSDNFSIDMESITDIDIGAKMTIGTSSGSQKPCGEQLVLRGGFIADEQRIDLDITTNIYYGTQSKYNHLTNTEIAKYTNLIGMITPYLEGMSKPDEE